MLYSRTSGMTTYPRTHFLILLATVVWVFFIFYLAAVPRIPRVPAVSASDLPSLGHYGTHLVLAALVYLGVAPVIPRPLQRVRALAMALGVALAVGMAVEGLQMFLAARSAQSGDLVADAMGAATGAGMVFALDRFQGSRPLLSVAAVGVVVMLMGGAGLSALIWNPAFPYQGDHWHALYRISICGETLPPLRGTPGGVHTHGRGFIHIHPRSDQDAGANATLARFMETSGGRLTDSSLTLPSGKQLSNGDPCPGGRAGKLVITVNGKALKHPSRYVLQNHDRVRIEFR